MTWTTETPTQPGWYWYHDPEINLGKPMPAWVFDANKMWWVTLCAVHGTSGVHGTVGTGSDNARSNYRLLDMRDV